MVLMETLSSRKRRFNGDDAPIFGTAPTTAVIQALGDNSTSVLPFHLRADTAAARPDVRTVKDAMSLLDTTLSAIDTRKHLTMAIAPTYKRQCVRSEPPMVVINRHPNACRHDAFIVTIKDMRNSVNATEGRFVSIAVPPDTMSASEFSILEDGEEPVMSWDEGNPSFSKFRRFYIGDEREETLPAPDIEQFNPAMCLAPVKTAPIRSLGVLSKFAVKIAQPVVTDGANKRRIVKDNQTIRWPQYPDAVVISRVLI